MNKQSKAVAALAGAALLTVAGVYGLGGADEKPGRTAVSEAEQMRRAIVCPGLEYYAEISGAIHVASMQLVSGSLPNKKVVQEVVHDMVLSQVEIDGTGGQAATEEEVRELLPGIEQSLASEIALATRKASDTKARLDDYVRVAHAIFSDIAPYAAFKTVDELAPLTRHVGLNGCING